MLFRKGKLEIDSSMLPDARPVIENLEDAGRRIGLLDFRPQKLGEFGTFKVKTWSVVK